MHSAIPTAVLFALATATSAQAVDPQFHSPSAASASWSVNTRVFGDADVTSDSGTGLGSHSVSSGGSGASAGLALSPVPYAAAYVNNGSGSGSSSASADLTYEYVFVASDGAAAASLATWLAAHSSLGADIAGTIKLSEDAQYGRSRGSIDGGGGAVSFACSNYYYRAASRCGANTFSTVGTLTRLSDLVFNGFLTLHAEASLSEGGSPGIGGGAPSFGAFVDPIISLAGGFGPGFTMSLSPGVANASGGSSPFGIPPACDPFDANCGAPPVPGVPEPTNWALLIAGFGLTGAVARARRRPAWVAA